MHKYFDAHHKDLLERIGAKDGLTDELKEAITAGLNEFKEQFKATQVAAV